MDIGKKAVSGTLWSFLDSIGNNGIQFIFNIILARILSPDEFGIATVLIMTILMLELFAEGGLTASFIRSQNLIDEEYYAYFLYCFFSGLSLYLLLLATSSFLDSFFKIQHFIQLIMVTGLILPLNSLGRLPTMILTKNIDFKSQTFISFSVTVASGISGMVMALIGMGVWSLIIMYLIRAFLNSILLWLKIKVPFGILKTQINFMNLKKHFSFSIKVYITNILNGIFNTLFSVAIAKFFSIKELGLYNRADQFNNYGSTMISSLVARVSFPVMSEIQDSRVMLIKYYRKFMGLSFFIVGLIMILLSSVSYSIVAILLGDKWIKAAEYLFLLSFTGYFMPVKTININLLYVLGKSNIVFLIEVISKITLLIVVAGGISYGIEIMIISTAILSFMIAIIYLYLSGNYLEIRFITQLSFFFSTISLLALSYFIIVFINSQINNYYIHLIIALFICIISLMLYLIQNFKFNINDFRTLVPR
jgi:teichuronic acid exporter